MLDNNNVNATNEATPGPSSSSDAALTTAAAAAAQNGAKRKRRPAGTPDPDAEVVSLSPRTLLESDRYVCEFCGQGFQREQNLQMHRRRHKVPWKASKRGAETAGKKRVYVCPEPSCLHHDARHALGDLVGIKKHYRRKHSNSKQWVCEKCSKGYAVQSDYKAHLKTCGTRGHSCDCGRVFSRVESFIEHQDACAAKRNNNGTDTQQQPLLHQPICSSTTPSATSPSSDANFSTAVPPLPTPTPTPLTIPPPPPAEPPISDSHHKKHSRLELQLLPSSPAFPALEDHAAGLNLSIGSCSGAAGRKSGVSEEMRMAMAEKSYAEETRQDARRQKELAELEFASAKRIREAAKAELEKAQVLKEQAAEKISAIMLEITCRACKQKLSEDNGGFRLRLDG